MTAVTFRAGVRGRTEQLRGTLPNPNSGVPNHGYALLVDGGTFNGFTVPAIGLTKAAHLYYQAMTVYQTPTTGFADHADALEASCNDLIGQPLKSLGVTDTPTGTSTETISSADCVAVSGMIIAVELRTDPSTQCNFQPLLSQATPSVCQSGQRTNVAYAENFEDGLAGWTLTNKGVYSGWPGTNWAATTSLPAGHSGTAAYGADVDGNCDGAGGDVSGAMSLQSPSILVPGDNQKAPRLTFDHNIASGPRVGRRQREDQHQRGVVRAYPGQCLQVQPVQRHDADHSSG